MKEHTRMKSRFTRRGDKGGSSRALKGVDEIHSVLGREARVITANPCQEKFAGWTARRGAALAAGR